MAIQENWRSTIGNPLKMFAETYTRPGTGAPASNDISDIFPQSLEPNCDRRSAKSRLFPPSSMTVDE